MAIGSKLLMILAALVAMSVACAPAAAPAPTATKPAVAPTSAPAPAKPTQPAKVVAPSPAASPLASPASSPVAAPASKPGFDAQAVSSFYRGKTIRIIVGSAPGGGYDTYARAIARHMGRLIPGEPNVIVENMPGAGSLRAANHVYKVGDKDGTVIGHIQGGLFTQQMLGLEGVEFEARKWQVLGAPARDNNTCVVTKEKGVKSLAEARKPNGKELIFGGNAPGSATWDVAQRLRVALNLNVKLIEGYDGTSKLRLAMDQGEIDGICGWGFESLRATGWDRVQAGDYVVVAQVSEKPLPELEQVPLALDMAQTQEDKDLIRLGIIVPSNILRPFVVAPEVPADRVAALRQAFADTLKDPEFLADATKAKLELNPLTGEEVQKLIGDLFAMPDSLKTKLRQINERKI